jgi:tRNA-splicing ligase RtcB
MNTKDFLRLGVPLGQATRRATDFVAKFILGGGDKSRLHAEVAAIVANPSAFLADELRQDFAKVLSRAGCPLTPALSPDVPIWQGQHVIVIPRIEVCR